MISETERQRRRVEQLLSKAEQLGGMGTFEVDLRTMQVTWSDELYRLHGYRPGEVEPTVDLILERVHPDDRPELEARSEDMLASPYQSRREYRIQLEDGAVRHLIGENEVEVGDDGRPLRLFGTVQDVTDRLLTERELLAHHELSQALNEWDDQEEGMVDLLRRLGTAMDWDAASLWVPAERDRDVLVCGAQWASDPVGLAKFESQVRSLRFPRGQGLAWHLWELMEPASVEDVETDPRIWAKAMILGAGFRSGLGFPAVHNGAPLAVLMFLSREPRQLTDRLMRTLTALGTDLGRFLARRRPDTGGRKLSAREREVLQLAADGLSPPMIGERLRISPATVKTHFSHAYEKLGVNDRAAAVAEAMRRGLFD